MLVALDHRYYFSMLRLGWKESLWDREDIHPSLGPWLHPSSNRERSLLLYALLGDDLGFCIPYELYFDSASLAADARLPPDGLIYERTGWRTYATNKTTSASSCLGQLHGLLCGRTLDPFGDEDRISLDPLALLPEAAVSIVSSLGGGPMRIPGRFLVDLIDSLLDGSRSKFESVAFRNRAVLMRIRESQEWWQRRIARGNRRGWKHTVLQPKFRRSRTVPGVYDDPLEYIAPDDLAMKGSVLELLCYSALVLSAAHRFADHLRLDRIYSCWVDPEYQVGLSMPGPIEKHIPKCCAVGFYSFAVDRFAKEGLYLPMPRTISEALDYRSHRAICDFRNVVWQWCDCVAAGEASQVAKLTRDISRAAKTLRRMRHAAKVGKYLTLASLPVSIGEAMLGLPVVGPAITAVGFATQMLSELEQRRNRWVQLLESRV